MLQQRRRHHRQFHHQTSTSPLMTMAPVGRAGVVMALFISFLVLEIAEVGGSTSVHNVDVSAAGVASTTSDDTATDRSNSNHNHHPVAHHENAPQQSCSSNSSDGYHLSSEASPHRFPDERWDATAAMPVATSNNEIVVEVDGPQQQRRIPEYDNMGAEEEQLFDDEEEVGEYDEDEEEEEFDPGVDFGVIQELRHEFLGIEDIIEKLQETEEYVEQFAATIDPFIYIRRDCWNKERECTIWAALGRCDENPQFMQDHCAPACGKCIAPTGPGVDFGVPQLLEYAPGGRPNPRSEVIVARLEETERYIKEVVWKEDFFTKVRTLCFNMEDMCTVWATKGECRRNADFMTKNCSPACQTCEQLHYETRCPVDPEIFPDIWQPGDLNRMFERVVADPNHDTMVWSRPDYLPNDDEETANYEIGPWIITIDDFLSPEEASHLIQWGARMGYQRSEEVGGVDEETGEALDSEVSEDRTSTNAWCMGDCDEDDIVVRLFDRMKQLTGVPPEHSEHLQLLKYEPNQFYLTHSDYIEGSDLHPGGPRILTVFMYLSEVEEGGETRFDWPDLLVTPKLGRVAIWPSVLDEDPNQMDERTLHEAMPVKQGQKYAANAWLHLRNYEEALHRGC